MSELEPNVRATCQICGSESLPWFEKTYDKNTSAHSLAALVEKPVRFFRCTRCQFIFAVDKAVSPEILDRYYERGMADQRSEYYEHDQSFGRRHRVMLDELSALLNLPARFSVLEIGCGAGHIVAGLPGAGYRMGIEPSLYACEIARRTYQDVDFVAAAFSADTLDRKFDVILLIDVIEHLPDPLAMIRDCAASLTPRGRLVIRTGNADCWAFRAAKQNCLYFHSPEHVSVFGIQSMHKALQPVFADVRVHPTSAHLAKSVLRKATIAVRMLGKTGLFRLFGTRYGIEYIGSDHLWAVAGRPIESRSQTRPTLVGEKALR